eukprot:g33156.t1
MYSTAVFLLQEENLTAFVLALTICALLWADPKFLAKLFRASENQLDRLRWRIHLCFAFASLLVSAGWLSWNSDEAATCLSDLVYLFILLAFSQAAVLRCMFLWVLPGVYTFTILVSQLVHLLGVPPMHFVFSNSIPLVVAVGFCSADAFEFVTLLMQLRRMSTKLRQTPKAIARKHHLLDSISLCHRHSLCRLVNRTSAGRHPTGSDTKSNEVSGCDDYRSAFLHASAAEVTVHTIPAFSSFLAEFVHWGFRCRDFLYGCVYQHVAMFLFRGPLSVLQLTTYPVVRALWTVP